MRTIMFTLSLAALLAFAAPAAAQTQPPQPPQPGQRVMLHLARRQPVEGVTGRQVRGTLVAADSASLSVELTPGAAPVRIPRAAVQQTYVSLGVPSRGQSAGMGAAMGIGAGMTASLTHMKDKRRSNTENALIGAVGGALGGALAGALFPRERWADAPTPGGISIAPTVTSNSHGLAVNIRL
ncbi:MAG TPA: hypothetical protein VGB15_15205 [Longimicrobium sp.]